MRILIIDDVKFSLLNISKLFEVLGHEVVSTTSAKQALTWLSQQQTKPFDMVLSDFCMPDMNGIELLENSQSELRKTLSSDLPPFVLFTTLQDEELNKQALKKGFSRVLKKPLTLDSIKQLVCDLEQGILQTTYTRKKVLALVSNQSLTKQLHEIIPSNQYQLECFNNIEEAKSFYKANPEIELIVTNKSIQGLDAIDFYHWCQNNTRFSDSGLSETPTTIVLTYNQDFNKNQTLADYQIKANQAGIQEVIPLSQNSQLIRKVLLHLNDMEAREADTKPSILIVDASAFVRTYIKNSLKTLGKEIKEASTLEQALKIYHQSNNLELVILDETFRDGDANEFMQQVEISKYLKQTGQNNGTQFVLMGVLSATQLNKKTEEAIFDDYLQKPLEHTKIKQLAEKLLKQDIALCL